MNNIKTLTMLLAIVGGLQLINIVLGTINGAMTEKFDLKKFIFGVLKAIVNSLCVVGTCALADIFAQVINTIEGITINAEIVSSLEIIAVVVVWAIDLFKDVLEKIKKLKTLKYISYDDVVLDDGRGTN